MWVGAEARALRLCQFRDVSRLEAPTHKNLMEPLSIQLLHALGAIYSYSTVFGEEGKILALVRNIL